MKGKIPLTERIILESKEDKWRMLTRGLINELKTTGLIQISPEKSVRLRLKITIIIPPEDIYKHIVTDVVSNQDVETSKGLSRISNYLAEALQKEEWVFVGCIEGENETPIIISHYPSLNLSIYTQKKKSENKKTFLALNSLN